MKVLRIGLLALLVALVGGVANATTVTGTIQDAGGNPYAFATMFAVLSNTAGVTPTVAGVSVLNSSIGFSLRPDGRYIFGPVALDSTGAFSITLPAAATVLPASTTYTFEVTGRSVDLGPAVPQVPVTFATTTGVTIAGGSQSVSTQINAVARRLGPNAPSASGITSLNALTPAVQLFAAGSAGTDFGISSTTATHTFNLPSSSAANRGLLLAVDWAAFNAKESPLTFSAPLVRTVNAITCPTASGSVAGCLSTIDWTTFNSKSSISGLTVPCLSRAASGTAIECSAVSDNGGYGIKKIAVGTMYVAPQPDSTMYVGDVDGMGITCLGLNLLCSSAVDGLTTVGLAKLIPVTVGTLPAAAAGNKGWMRQISDSTAVVVEGQTCVGSGSATALAFSDGTVWKCF